VPGSDIPYDTGNAVERARGHAANALQAVARAAQELPDANQARLNPPRARRPCGRRTRQSKTGHIRRRHCARVEGLRPIAAGRRRHAGASARRQFHGGKVRRHAARRPARRRTQPPPRTSNGLPPEPPAGRCQPTRALERGPSCTPRMLAQTARSCLRQGRARERGTVARARCTPRLVDRGASASACLALRLKKRRTWRHRSTRYRDRGIGDVHHVAPPGTCPQSTSPGQR